jgi:hydroxymethylglutaryl-CoA synthase
LTQCVATWENKVDRRIREALRRNIEAVHMDQRVGIEALAVALPRRYLSLDDLARARGVDPDKYVVGLGAREMAIADPSEDTVALAANAGARLLRAHDVDPTRIGMLVVGTETGVDHAKAVASFVQGLLGLPRTMRTFDTQHACYGGTAALMAVSDWIGAGHANGRAALVICADVARYGVATPGEPTQGAGAVAMLVSDRPDLLVLDRALSGVFSTDVHDFCRPLGRSEALLDGHYSIACYLDAVAGAYRMWRTRASSRGVVLADRPASEQLARIAYHVPFCKMAHKAHQHVRKCDLDEQPDARFVSSFDAQVAPSLYMPSRVGNTYTASLYFGLASLLHQGDAALAGQRIGMFSYGSGCASEFFSGVVGPRAVEIIARARLDEALAERVRIDVAEYERIAALDRPMAPMQKDGRFHFMGLAAGRRRYLAAS